MSCSQQHTEVDISVLVPTRNESGNVALLTARLTDALDGLEPSWELLFLDDSDDATPQRILDLRGEHPNLSLVHRDPADREGGLAGAVVTGFGAAQGRAIVVMDGDLQHPPELAGALAQPVLAGECDVAIGSRYVAGASARGLGAMHRHWVSRASAALVHFAVPSTRGVHDPMSGFFAVRREALAGAELRPHGFKILLEVLARGGAGRVIEVPFVMAERVDGTSKAGVREGTRFLRHVARLAHLAPRSRLGVGGRAAELRARWQRPGPADGG